jgi:dihydroneopterin triphosphate diphosphatase
MKTDQVECIVFRKKEKNIEFLLLKRIPKKGGFWQPICGGKEETDKSLIAAAFRELKEEANILQKDIITIFPSFYFFEINKHYLTGKPISPIKEYVFGFETNSNVVISIKKNIYPEHDEIRWVSFEEAIKLLKWENNKDALKKLNELLQ